MRRISVFTAIVFMLFARAACGVTVALERVVYYGGDTIRLADCATVDGANASILSAIGSETLSVKAPVLYVIPQRTIRGMIAPHTSETVVITGNGLFLVPDSASDGEKRFFARLLDFMELESGSDEGRLEVTVTEPLPRSVLESGGAISFGIWNKKTKLGFLEGRMRIECADASTGMTERFGVSVRQYVSALEATDTIAKDEILSWDKLKAVEIPVSALDSDALSAFTRIGRYKAKSNIRQGSAVYSKNVEQLFDVKARDAVTLVFDRGSIRITMDGISTESGSLGDIVSVKPADAEKSFSGRITGQKEVTIDVQAD